MFPWPADWPVHNEVELALRHFAEVHVGKLASCWTKRQDAQLIVTTTGTRLDKMVNSC